ncbi:MAG: TlpA family protein disulfide reductase [Devosia sp.]|uniref:TlpA disulfide reductase family protein n=1 Tax=Devosia sp. TaxID=1871048 RepID=UPI001ACB1832|nr:TlpA disulfide reductase family protein [Devosia sp.]MBN9310432.1 TlpA family protein disulfide reductase [Devosia sp.]MBN9315142.1 TlpA family protein disulfide reductase [Devosia sp.]
MTDQSPAPVRRMRPMRVLLIALASAAVALVLTLVIGNFMPAQAHQCPAQVVKGQKIDAAAVGLLAALTGTGEGRGYADMAFKDQAGAPRTIADFAGRKLLVNFWASWCVPCRAEMPALDRVAAEYNSDRFMVLPINLDIGEGGLEKARKFLADENLHNLPLYADSSFSAFERLKQQAVAVGLPATLLLDEKGCELAVLQGPAEWDSPDGKAVIDTLIGS